MDRFHNQYGTLNSEAQEIIAELSTVIMPTLRKYQNDIEALIFLREAISFLYSDISGEVLMYSHKKLKEEKLNVQDKTQGK